MKGLIIKDLYMTLKYCKMLFLMEMVFVVVSFLVTDTMFMMFPILFSGVIPITLLSCDERCGWTVYSGTMPYSEVQLVSAKYITGPLIGSITSAVILGCMILHMSLSGDADIAGAAAVVGILFAASLLIPALCLPFCYKFGTEKGRIVYFVVIFLVAIGARSVIDPDSGSLNFTGITAIIPAAVALLYAVSWVISAALFKGKTPCKA